MKDQVLIDVIGLWTKAGLPVLSKQRIEAKLKDLIEKYNTARKKVMKRGGSKVDEGWLHSLFDVCTCKCFIPESPVVHNKKCTCSCEVADSNCNYTLFTKLPWPGDSEGTFQSSSQDATCPSVYHTRWKLHTVPLIAERQAGKL